MAFYLIISKNEKYAIWTKTGLVSQRNWSVMQNCPGAGFIEALQIWTHWTSTSLWGAVLERYHELQSKPRTTDELKAALRLPTIWEELPQEHINKAVANFPKRLTVCMVIGCQLWSLRASAITLSISNSASLSRHQQTFLFTATNRLPVKTTLGTLRNGDCLIWNSIILSFSDIF